MKKQDFYINTIGGMDNIDYPKVSGYVEEIEDSDGNKTKIGYNKKGKEKGKNCKKISKFCKKQRKYMCVCERHLSKLTSQFVKG